jgi:phage I-like protein
VKHFLLTFLTAILILTGVAGCTTENAPALNDAKRAVCEPLRSLRTAAASLQNIDAETSVEQLRALRESTGKLVEAARRANTVFQNQSITDMVTAYDGFSQSVDDLSTQQSVGEATESVRASATQVLAALNQAYDSIPCAQ